MTCVEQSVSIFTVKSVKLIGVRQMQTADLQTRTWVSQTSVSYRSIGIGIGIYSIYSYR